MPIDIAILGGGSAGLAAAITAARAGATTLLIERYGYLGGMGTASLVHTFCGLYLLREEPGAVLANPGIPTEIAERMIAATGIGPQRMGRVDVLPQNPIEFVRIADELCAAEPNLTLALHSEMTDLTPVPDAWKITLSTRSQQRTLQARKLIDASGDAVTASFLSKPTEITQPAQLQRPAYLFGIHGPNHLDDATRLHTAGLLVSAVRSGQLPPAILGLTFRSTGTPHQHFASLDLTGGETTAHYNPLDPDCLTALEIQGRHLATQAIRWLAANDPIWHRATITQWPIRAGVRESRRWIGQSILTGDDLLNSRRFPDEVALATWPMEFRETTKGPKLRFPTTPTPCGIPASCLIPKGIPNLFIAGRCISADHDAQASIRVMGTCFATGQAAANLALASL
jgi:hypothetical protein